MRKLQKEICGSPEFRFRLILIVVAFKTDSTRVITYRQPVGTLLKFVSVRLAPHDTSGRRAEISQNRDIVQSELLAG
jgi:hypothetical protein